MLVRVTALVLLALVGVPFGTTVPLAGAQTTDDLEVAPIECWTRTSASAVRVGELFTLVLTCAVLETQAATVVPDRSTLDPGALQVPPFEVVRGALATDVRTSSRRLFQYEYTVRYLGEEFGADTRLPGPTVTYRVQSRVQQGAAIEGREREYNLPSTPIRILSLVPAAAADIREPAPETFQAIQDRRFRAQALRIAAIALFALAGVMVLWALVGLARRPGREAAVAVRGPSEASMLRAVRRELDVVRRARPGGWTSDLAARALMALRIAATLAMSRRISQTPTSSDITPMPGQLLLRPGWGRGRAVLVSGSATAETLASTPALAELRSALEHLTTATYGHAALDENALDEALGVAERATARVAREYTWLARSLRSVTRSAGALRDRAWAR